MSTVTINGSRLGGPLQTLLMCEEIVPGSEPSYQLCKTIYVYHPLGAKMAESPIALAQSQEREIAIPKAPEEDVRKQFLDEWKNIGADAHIFNVMRLSRAYGISSIALLVKDVASSQPIDYTKLWQQEISFNVADPLNTAGSLVLNQNPNALDFQKVVSIAIAGVKYHRSRAVVMMNEDPLYIEYTTSAFGYVGRSVYQRALFPLKSFVQTMVADDMVARKAGLLVAMLKAAGSVVDNLMAAFAGMKRQLLKEAETNNVLSIEENESIESLDLANLEGPLTASRKNILENIAVSADMPAKLLNSETFAEGFGEGTEDAKAVAKYIDRVRRQMQPLYDYFDRIVMYRAWNEDFYKTIQKKFPDEYGSVPYLTAFQTWQNSFAAVWPNLLTEPDSEKSKVDDVKLRAMVAVVEVLLPNLDPENKAIAIEWMTANLNDLKFLYDQPLELDFDALKNYVPPVEDTKTPKPEGFKDSQPRVRKALDDLGGALEKLNARGRKLRDDPAQNILPL